MVHGSLQTISGRIPGGKRSWWGEARDTPHLGILVKLHKQQIPGPVTNAFLGIRDSASPYEIYPAMKSSSLSHIQVLSLWELDMRPPYGI